MQKSTKNVKSFMIAQRVSNPRPSKSTSIYPIKTLSKDQQNFNDKMP